MKKDMPISFEEQLRRDCPAIFKLHENFPGQDMSGQQPPPSLSKNPEMMQDFRNAVMGVQKLRKYFTGGNAEHWQGILIKMDKDLNALFKMMQVSEKPAPPL